MIDGITDFDSAFSSSAHMDEKVLKSYEPAV